MRNAVAVALVAVAVFGVPSLPEPVKPTPAVLVEAARPVREIVRKMDASDAALFRATYANAAKIVEHDQSGESLINSTDDLRRFHVAMLRFLWNGAGGNSLDKYEGLRDAVDTALNDAIGDDSRPLTADLRGKAVRLFSAIGG
jgi:hypothetical protein